MPIVVQEIGRVVHMNKIDEILNDEDFELRRLICEIKAKNGLPPQNDIDYTSTGRINSKR